MTTDTDLQESLPEEEELVTDELETELPEGEEAVAEEPEVELPEPLDPPPKWDKRYKDVFNQWSEHPNGREWQEAIIEQYNQGQGYTTQVEQERAQLRQYAETMDAAIAPYRELIAMSGATPDAFVRQALGLTMSLQRNPRETLTRLAQGAGIDLQQLTQDQPYVDPTVQALQQRYDQLQNQFVQRERQQAQQFEERIRAENAQQLQAFATAKDASGNDLHPHLETVQHIMAELISGREAQRRSDPNLMSLTLDEAYERACKLSPEVSQASEAEKGLKTAAARAAQAKKAADAAKRTTGKASGKDAPSLSLEDEIRQNWRKTKSAA